MFGAILYVPLIYQGVLGIAATNSGLLITPMMVGLVGASLISGQIITRIERYRLVGTVGILVMMTGLWLLSQITTGSSELEVVRRGKKSGESAAHHGMVVHDHHASTRRRI